MSYFDSWHGPLPKRRRFDLSDGSPIRVSLSRHERRTELPSFDMHYELELGILLEGSMARHYGDERMEASAADVWFCGMWEPHGFRVLEAPCEAVIVLVWPPLLATAHFPELPEVRWLAPFAGEPASRPRLSREKAELAVGIARRMMAAAEEGAPASAFRQRLLLFELLAELIPARGATGDGGLVSAPASYSDITPALELVFSERRLVTNEEAADTCAMSRDSFIRRFRDLMGISFSRFALRHRLSSAAGELAAGDAPIKAVAREWGFSDESHLHRLCMQHYGCSPAQYRRRARGEDGLKDAAPAGR